MLQQITTLQQSNAATVQLLQQFYRCNSAIAATDYNAATVLSLQQCNRCNSKRCAVTQVIDEVVVGFSLLSACAMDFVR